MIVWCYVYIHIMIEAQAQLASVFYHPELSAGGDAALAVIMGHLSIRTESMALVSWNTGTTGAEPPRVKRDP